MYPRHLLATASLLGLAAAQTYTDCNPTKKTNCAADPGFGTDHTFNFNATPSHDLWETTAGSVSYDGENGAAFTIAKQGDSPTIRTNFYFFFGRIEIWLKSAPGRGIVSSTMWLSDDLDEVDWEFLGVNDTVAFTNYFSKGLQDYHNGGTHSMPGGLQDDFHNYTTVWTKEQIGWYIDGSLVRTLTADAANNTSTYPQTPMRLSIGIWAGGDPSLSEGIRNWAGGDTDYAKGPYTMYVKSARVTDFSSGKQYSYGDDSGSMQSIKIVEGNSTALDALNNPPPEPKKTFSEKWNEVPQGAKIGIYCSVGAVCALLVGSLMLCCIRQRHMGAKEARLTEEREQADRMEMDKLKREGMDSDARSNYSHEYSAGGTKESMVVNAGSTSIPVLTLNPFENKSWEHIDSPMRSPASVFDKKPLSPCITSPAGSCRDARSSPNLGQFDFGVPPSLVTADAPARNPSPGLMRCPSPAASLMSSPRSRVGSPNPQQMGPGPEKMPSPGPLAQIRNFSTSHAGYRELPEVES